jgi:hypothetical protein
LKAHRHGSGNTARPEILAERGLDALQRERFKDAIELFKQAIRAEPRTDWRERLAEAYRGRARDLAAKGMFKEAGMVLENTIVVAGGVIRDPELYLSCLIRDGQQQKAAVYLLNHPPEHEDLEALAAAVLVSVPQLPDLAPSATPEQRRWRDLAIASRAALAAWWDGASATEVDGRLDAISLRSAFRPIRLLLKTLISPREDADRTRRVLDTIQPGSPFFPLRQAVAAALLRGDALDADTWNRLTPRQQTFVAETAGLPPGASQFLARIGEAERGGPGALFHFLLKQAELPQADVRNACINLLPHVPDRVSQFERSFGALSPVERSRIQALAAEERGDWEAAAGFWSATAGAIARGAVAHRGSDRASNLARGVIYRHLADIAGKHPEVEANDGSDDPVVAYLIRACEADPDHLQSHLDVIGRYRADASSASDSSAAKDWHQSVEETVKRFPDDARVLQQALDSALARKAYKQAATFARRVLRINAINPGVRRQMIELQIAYARKQMRARRPDLALKGLAEAAEWERADAPSAPLRIARALVERTGATDQTEARLREGVALAGGGVAGWFRARLEADFMKAGDEVGWLQQELARARETPPTGDAIMAIVAALGQPEAGDNKKAVASLLLGLRPWLQKGATIDWKPSEFQAMAEMLARFEAYDLLRDYAKAARQRDPANPSWRFHEIVGRTQGKADRLSMAEEDELMAITEAAGERQDFHMVTRIARFLDQDAKRRGLGRRRGGWGSPDPDDDMDGEDMMALFAAMLSEMPRATAANLRDLVKDIGREKAIAELAGQMKFALGQELPPGLLQELCAAMVAQAMGGGGRSRQGASRPGAARHGLPF